MAAGAANLEDGTKLGRFVIRQRLGGGTSGTVYLAEDPFLDTHIAIKVLNQNVEEIVVKRFKREILLARRILHPGVCRVFDMHEHGDVLFSTMEYIPGDTLEGVLKREEKLDVSRATRVMRDVCQAVGAAHDAGILHRDLKPANIVLALGRRPTVVDFGSATAGGLGRVTQVGRVVGTLRYMAPEILQGLSEATERTDLYSLGLIYYRCLTGRFPYEATTIEELVARAPAVHPPPSRFRPEIQPHVDDVVARALTPKPEDRFKTTAEFEAALGVLVEDTTPKVMLDEHSGQTWDGDIEKTVTSVIRVIKNAQSIGKSLTSSTVLFAHLGSVTQLSSGGKTPRHVEESGRSLVKEIRSWGGTVIKSADDALIALFDTPHDGVSAAIAMQRTLRSKNAALPVNQETTLRIGVHSGSTVLEGDAVSGAGVDVATRLCARAGAEEIVISPATHKGLSYSDVPIETRNQDENLNVIWNEITGITQNVRLSSLGDMEPTAVRKRPSPPPSSSDAPAFQWASEKPAPRMGAKKTQEPKAKPTSVNASNAAGSTSAKKEPDKPPSKRVKQWGLTVEDSGASKAPTTAKEDPWQSKCKELVKNVENELTARGFIRGDHQAVDKLLETAARLSDQEKFEQAARFLELARGRIGEVAIDRAFIVAKITRLNQAIAAAKDVDTDAFAQQVKGISQQSSARQFAAANAALNDAFSRLSDDTKKS